MEQHTHPNTAQRNVKNVQVSFTQKYNYANHFRAGAYGDANYQTNGTP